MASGSGLSGRTGSAAAADIGSRPSNRTNDDRAARSLDMTLPFRHRCLSFDGAHAPTRHGSDRAAAATWVRPNGLGLWRGATLSRGSLAMA